MGGLNKRGKGNALAMITQSEKDTGNVNERAKGCEITLGRALLCLVIRMLLPRIT